mgnify:CR=1 FL=1
MCSSTSVAKHHNTEKIQKQHDIAFFVGVNCLFDRVLRAGGLLALHTSNGANLPTLLMLIIPLVTFLTKIFSVSPFLI